jgi:uncharacterized protein (DUF2384 family)
MREIEMVRAEIRRGYRNAAIGSAVGVGVLAALRALRTVMVGRGPVHPIPSLVFNFVSAAMLGAACAMIISQRRIERRMQEATGSDPDVTRRIARVVLRGKSEDLSEEEQHRAARFAAIVTHSVSFDAVQSATFFAAFSLGQIGNIIFPPRGIEPDSLMNFFLAAMATVLAITWLLMLRTRQRAKRWAAMHDGF